MKKYRIILTLFIASFFLASSTVVKNKKLIQYKWSGTVTRTQTNISKGNEKAGVYKKEWDNFSKFSTSANFVNNKGTVIRSDTTSNFEKDSTDMGHGKYIVEERTTKIYCNGNAVLELSVESQDGGRTYWISFFTPDCQEIMTSKLVSNIRSPENHTTTMDHEGTQINIPNQRIGNNPNELSGRIQEHIPPSGPGGGDIYTTITWNLKKVR